MNQAEQDLLVLTAQNGNQKAFGRLFDLYHRSLVGFSFSLSKDRELSNDAVQEAWIKAARNIRELKDPRAFKSWIYRLVRWKTMDLLRQATRQEVRLDVFDEENSELSGEISEPENQDLAAAIKSLPATEKQIIHLFYLDELKMTEVAAVLDVPVGTVKSRLNRARNLLKQGFQKPEC